MSSWTCVTCHAGICIREWCCSSCVVAEHSLRASFQACKQVLLGICVAEGVAVTRDQRVGCSGPRTLQQAIRLHFTPACGQTSCVTDQYTIEPSLGSAAARTVMPFSALGCRTVLLLAAATLLTAQTTVSDAQQRSRRRLHGNVQTSTRRPRGLGPDDPWCWSSPALCSMPACLLPAHADRTFSLASCRVVRKQQQGAWCR